MAIIGGGAATTAIIGAGKGRGPRPLRFRKLATVAPRCRCASKLIDRRSADAVAFRRASAPPACVNSNAFCPDSRGAFSFVRAQSAAA